jgi:hypothetical protein
MIEVIHRRPHPLYQVENMIEDFHHHLIDLVNVV